MHRQPLLQGLQRYRAEDPADASRCERVMEFARRRSDCFLRTCAEGHIVASAWLVSGCGDRVLLTHHRKLGLWLQPGGHTDGQSDVAAAALREAREESGIQKLRLLSREIFDVDVHVIPARAAEPEHIHYDVRFVVQAMGDQDFQVSDESLALQWVDMASLDSLVTEESMLRMRRKWLRGWPSG